MVTFVPAFVSQEVADWEKMAENEVKRIEAQTTDTSGAASGCSTSGSRRIAEPQATLAQVADHIDHVRKVAGVDHVGDRERLRRDHDHAGRAWRTCPPSPASSPSWSRRGWSDDDLRKLAGRNLLRVLRGAEGDGGPAAARAAALDPDDRAARPAGSSASALIQVLRATTRIANATAIPANRNHWIA